MRRWLAIGGAAFLLLAAVASIAALVYLDRIGEWVVRSEILPELEDRLGRQVSVGEIDVARRVIALRGVEVAGGKGGEPLATIREVTVRYGLLSAIRGRPEIGSVTLEGARVRVDAGAEGGADRELFERLAGTSEGGAATEGEGGRSMRPDSVALVDSALTLVDEGRGVTISVRGIDGKLEVDGSVEARIGHAGLAARAGPTGSASDLRVTADLADPVGTAAIRVGDGRVSLSGDIALTGIRGEIASAGGTRLDIDLAGSYGGATEALWAARGWVDPRAREGALTVEAERFSLDRIAHVLDGAPIRAPEKLEISASLDVEVGPDAATLRGDVDVSGLTVAHSMIASQPVEDVRASARVDGEIDRLTRALWVEDAEVYVEGVRYALSGYVWLPGGLDPITGRVREAMRLGGRVAVDPVDCQAMLASIPEALVPQLQGFELDGEFSADLHLDVDLEQIDATRLGGEVGIHGCRVLAAPEKVAARRLRGPFRYGVQVAEDDWLPVVVGPDDPDFVPIDQVSPHLVNSLMTTEDSGFFSHDGFVRRQFREALVRNLESGYFRYGASSITMQMVKNVLLEREKTLSRKLQELFLTWYVETALDKERIMEIYVNAIEFGPGIYGIGEAARHYFGKSASALNPVESAFFSSILPNPKGRYRQFCRGELTRYTEGMIERVVDLMHERDRLSAIEHQIAHNTPLFFDRSHVESEGGCLQKVSRAIRAAPSTSPTLEDDETGEVASR